MSTDNFILDQNKLKYFKKVFNISSVGLEALVRNILMIYHNRVKYYKTLIDEVKFLALDEVLNNPSDSAILNMIFSDRDIFTDMQRTIDSCIDDLLFIDYCNLNWR